MHTEQEIIFAAGRIAPPPQEYPKDEITVNVLLEGIDYIVTFQKGNNPIPRWKPIKVVRA